MHLICTRHKNTFADFSNYKVQGKNNFVTQCFDSGWHRGHVSMLYLAWSGEKAFLTQWMPSRTRKFQRICVVLELQIIRYLVGHLAAMKIIKILLFF